MKKKVTVDLDQQVYAGLVRAAGDRSVRQLLEYLAGAVARSGRVADDPTCHHCEDLSEVVDDGTPIQEWQMRILEDRWDEAQRHPDDVLSWEEVERSVWPPVAL